ncbi:MAG: O-antigen ligase family protein [Bacteroidota bacterium]
MDPFLFKLSHEKVTPASNSFSVWDWMRNELIKKKLETPLGYLLLIGIALLFSWQIGNYGWISAAVWLLVLCIIPLLVVSMFNLKFGLYMTVIAAFLVMGLKKITGDLPLGLFLDASILMMIFGVYLKQIRRRDWRALYHTFTVLTAVWLGYNFIQLFNPYSPSQIAWFYEVRNTGLRMVLFFIPLFAFTKFDDVRKLGYMWIALTTLGALYAIVQHTLGLQRFERLWLLEEVAYLDKVFIDGTPRNFSFFSSPGIMGILMGGTSIFCMPLMLSTELEKKYKLALAASVVLMWIAMFLSGTRTAFVVVPVACLMIVGLSLNKKLAIWLGVVALIWGIMYVIPSENIIIQRYKSTFTISESTSYQDRVNTQEFLKPFIRSHPIGGGIGLTGKRGRQFSPDRMITEIRLEGGYIQLAIEMGWIGLGIFLGILFVISSFAVRYYFRIKDPELKLWTLAFLGALFAFCMGNYSQIIFNSLPTSLFLYLSMACFVLLRRFDNEDRSFDAFAW